MSQEKLYRQFYPALYTLCKTFFENNHDILTALNNGMLRVYKNIERFDPNKGTLFNWVYTIVRNAALTLVRDKKTETRLELFTDDLAEKAIYNPFREKEWHDIYLFLGKVTPYYPCYLQPVLYGRISHPGNICCAGDERANRKMASERKQEKIKNDCPTKSKRT